MPGGTWNSPKEVLDEYYFPLIVAPNVTLPECATFRSSFREEIVRRRESWITFAKRQYPTHPKVLQL